jgi:hypothetical protein
LLLLNYSQLQNCLLKTAGKNNNNKEAKQKAQTQPENQQEITTSFSLLLSKSADFPSGPLQFCQMFNVDITTQTKGFWKLPLRNSIDTQRYLVMEPYNRKSGKIQITFL